MQAVTPTQTRLAELFVWCITHQQTPANNELQQFAVSSLCERLTQRLLAGLVSWHTMHKHTLIKHRSGCM